jgi:hypothetical protein
MKKNTDYEYDTLLSAYEQLCEAWWFSHWIDVQGSRHTKYPLGLFYTTEATEQEKENYENAWWAWIKVGEAMREIYRAMSNEQREKSEVIQQTVWKRMLEAESK